MIKLAVVIVHNKTSSENEAQITALASLLQPHTITVPELDEAGNEIGTSDVFTHYTVKNLTQIEHEIKVFQIIPYQPTNTSDPYEAEKPANMNLLVSHNVYYGKNDTDKVGTHPRFFNWGLKRGTDYGADVAIYLADPVALTATKARNALGKLTNNTEFVEEAWGKLATKKLLQLIGQLKEDKTFTEAINDYKTRITEGGLKNG